MFLPPSLLLKGMSAVRTLPQLMVLRYAHPTEQHQAEAARRLEEFNTSRAIAEIEQQQAATTVSTTVIN